MQPAPICRHCKCALSEANTYPSQRALGQAICRKCSNDGGRAARQKWDRANKEKVNEYHMAHYWRNRDRINEARKARRDAKKLPPET